MKSGVLNVYKEKGFTSHDVVAKIRKLYGTKKVGHTGTLDPQATGCLPVLIGSAVKACDLIPEEGKTYRATVRFGIETDTEDIWGKVIKRDEKRPDKATFRSRMLTFLGEYHQIPPMVSAIKVDGKKLYEYAREGKVIKREARRVFVHDFELLSFSDEEACVRATVSKGTYIRTLLVDLCASCGVLGAMSALEREKSGAFSLSTARTLSQIEAMTPRKREDALLPTEELFSSYPRFVLPSFFDQLIMNGCAVRVEKLGLTEFKVGQVFRLYEKSRFVALGKVIEDEGEKALFKIKNFN